MNELHKAVTETWDCHVHFPYKDAAKGPCYPANLSQFIEGMKKAGISRAAGNAWEAINAKDGKALRAANVSTLAAAGESDGFIIPVVMVNPHFEKESVEALEWARDNGIRIAGEVCGYIIKHKYKGRSFDRIMEKAAKLGITVQIHLWEPPQGLVLAKKYPGTKFLFPHFAEHTHGNILDIEKLAPHKNVSVDVSGTAVFRTGVPEHAIETLGPERVLFGTDYFIDEPLSTRVRTEIACRDTRTLELVMRKNLKAITQAE